jgi:ribonucleoside-diphosphate reductase beta chain
MSVTDTNVVSIKRERDLGELHGVLKQNAVYKPFKYPWAFDYWQQQQQVHWLPEEVPMSDDVKDWKNKITDGERNLLTQIFRFFTQGDIEVNDCYMTQYASVFGPTEIKMMLSAFSNMETIHIAAYSHLLDTIGIPEVEYEAFLQYKEMSDKYEYLHNYKCDSKEGIALTMAVFAAFTEGLQLFASFAILMNFPRHGKMKGMGQIITWSVRDESLHCEAMSRLFRTFIHENEDIWTEEVQQKIYQCCRDVIKLEDAFIDLAFEMGDIEGLKASEVKQYIRYIANMRLGELTLEPIFENVDKNPLPWMDDMLNGVEHTNFFENRSTEYSRAATQGTWDDAFAIHEDDASETTPA